MTTSFRISTVAAFCFAMAWLGIGLPANAGCGCDHPPPAQATIMPPFASPGTAIRIYVQRPASFKLNSSYKVDFGGAAVNVLARNTDWIEAVVPVQMGTSPGPKKIRVQGSGYDREYASSLFTALPPPAVIPADGGFFGVWKYASAVDADGTMLIALDVSQVLDPLQFSFYITNFGLAFSHDDVVIYNSNGLDLTLFTLMVGNTTLHQWGEYFGWRVDEDRGLFGEVYEHKVLKKGKEAATSDLLTYWRHEFRTYRNAHLLGGSHMVDANGYHPDGTYHVDHGRLVIAIHGRERDKDPLKAPRPLVPGKREIDLVVTALPAAGPVAGSTVLSAMSNAVARSVVERNRGVADRTFVRLPN